jgi:hypothetical protein
MHANVCLLTFQTKMTICDIVYFDLDHLGVLRDADSTTNGNGNEHVVLEQNVLQSLTMTIMSC